jgi:hypothetical protein
MGRITAEVEYTEIEGDNGPVDGVRVTCTKCSHSTESGGTGEPSLKHCAALLRDECPLNEWNFYVLTE